MASLATPPPSAPSGGSNYDMIGSALADTGVSQPDSQPSGDTGAGESTTDPTIDQQTEQALADAGAGDGQPEVQQQEPNPYDTNEDAEVPQQTLDSILATPRGKEIYQSHKAMREFAKPLEQGGIGHVPSVEQVRDYYGAYRDRVMMDHDLTSGDVKGAAQFINHLFGPQADGKLRPNIDVAAAQIAPTLANSSPEAYAMAAEPFINNYNTRLWDRFNEAKDPALKNALYYAAQLVQKDLTGKYRSEAELGTQQPQQVQDPLATERAQLAAERQQIANARQQDAQAYTQQWERSVNSQIHEALNAEMDLGLAPVKAMFKDSPEAYEALKDRFRNIVRQGVPSDSYKYDLFQTDYQGARSAGTRDRADNLVQHYMQMAKREIGKHRMDFMKKAGLAGKAQNDQLHSELRSIDSHRSPSNGGAPVTPGRGPSPVRNNNETAADYNLRLLRM